MSLTHFDGKGDAHMVDVSDKPMTSRIAVAETYIKMQRETFDIITEGRAKKGDVMGVARLAGIMAAKRTSDLIPLCHPLPITKVSVELTPDADLPGLRHRRAARRQLLPALRPAIFDTDDKEQMINIKP